MVKARPYIARVSVLVRKCDRPVQAVALSNTGIGHPLPRFATISLSCRLNPLSGFRD